VTSKPFRLPPVLVALDAFGTILLVLGLLGALDVDIGLPVLARIWPFLVATGAALMTPLIVWAVRSAAARRKSQL